VLLCPQIVLMPYSVLLHDATRESYGFTAEALSRCVVVLDEAHNVVDAISNMHSCSVTLPQLSSCFTLITAYLSKYRTRMSSSTIRWLSSFSVFLSSLRQYLSLPATIASDCSMQLLPEFIANCHLNSLDFVGLERFLSESGLSRKLRGFDHAVVRDSDGDTTTSCVGSYHACVAFLSALLTVATDGRVLVKAQESVAAGRAKPPFFKFCLLNPGSRFRPVVEAARSVVLIGGTLQPINGLVYQLLRHVPPEGIVTHSCGHVVPPSQVLAICLTRGPCSDVPFNFTHSRRDDVTQLRNLGQAVVNCVTILPKGSGCVVFLPSYDFEESCWTHWRTVFVAASIEKHCQVPGVVGGARFREMHWSNVGNNQQVFREPRGSSESPLEAYTRCIASVRGRFVNCVVVFIFDWDQIAMAFLFPGQQGFVVLRCWRQNE
jgi:chromosome transmission fidelity protein 1